MKSKLNVEHIYVLSVVSAFALLFFANADQQKLQTELWFNWG